MNRRSNINFPVTLHGEPLACAQPMQAGESQWYIPEEVPVAFVYNRRNYAVMMATPDDLVDFMIGFSKTEGIIRNVEDIDSLDIYLSDKGADLRIKLSADCLEKFDVTQRRRNLVGSASCGLCGLENADVLFKKLPKVEALAAVIPDTVLKAAMSNMEAMQPLNQQTRSVHAAAWVANTGQVECIREDVGRHNALDKLLGALAIDDVDIRQGFVLMSSRCSYEIVEKAARCGVSAILSISGPTAFALRKAKEANMALYARSGAGAVRLL